MAVGPLSPLSCSRPGRLVAPRGADSFILFACTLGNMRSVSRRVHRVDVDTVDADSRQVS